MATQIKLTYFPIIGLAEPIRFLLAYLGKEYEDFRFDRKDWPEIKKEWPARTFNESETVNSENGTRKGSDKSLLRPVFSDNFTGALALRGPAIFVRGHQVGHDGPARISFLGPPKLRTALPDGTPWGKSPVLEIGGQKVTQSIAITRYLGKEAGLAGKDSWEDMRIDEIVGVIDDMRAEIANFHYDPDEVRKAGKLVPLVNEIVPFYMKKLDAHVKENNRFLANGKLSWADFYFSAISEYLSYMFRSDITDGYPNVKDLKMRIYALPAIKAWIDRRPANIYPTYPNL
ncbi:hypothetical protein J6590_003665 [Homalodisca vitripennis]|nr:hypothetical protein J6590_003665 [Homalodisca vitripennis]